MILNWIAGIIRRIKNRI